MGHGLFDIVRIVEVSPAIAAGSSDVTNLTAIDMLGAEGVLFILGAGTLTATQVTSLRAQGSSDNAVADAYDDLAGTSTGPFADGDGGKVLALDIFRPQKRYVKPIIKRATANAVINHLTAIVYNLRIAPVLTQDTTVSAFKLLNSPAEGTA